MSAYIKDIWRTVKRGKKRFISLMLITILGVTTMTGLRASCSDLRYSADEFFDKQGLFDVQVVSTLGLTEDDLTALGTMEAVQKAEGIYSEEISLKGEDEGKSAEIVTLSTKGINVPYVVEGHLPTKTNEIAVSEKYKFLTGRGVGDKIHIAETVEEDVDPNFKHQEYTITAVVIDARDVNNVEGATTFRAPSTTDYTFFVTKEAISSDVYTSIYINVKGAKELGTYSKEYEEKISNIITAIERDIKTKREKARYDEVVGEANEEIADAEKEMNEEFAKADKEFADAWADIDKGKEDIRKGREELAKGKAKAEVEFAKARQEISDNRKLIAEGQAQIEDKAKEVADGKEQLSEGEKLLLQTEEETLSSLDNAIFQMKDSKANVDSQYSQLSANSEQLMLAVGSSFPKAEWNSLVGSATSAYGDVAKYTLEKNMLEMRLLGMEEGSSEYEQTKAQIATVTGLLDDANAKVTTKTAGAINDFSNKLSPVISNYVSYIEGQIPSLDVTAPDYAEKKQQLEMQKQQLLALEGQLIQVAMGMGQTKATSLAIDGSIADLQGQRAVAVIAFNKEKQTIADNKALLISGEEEIAKNRVALNDSLNQLIEGEKELVRQEIQVRSEMEEGERELDKGERELLDGENTLKEEERDYFSKKAEAIAEIADAKEKLKDIDTAKWYVQNRSSLSGYNNIDTDSSSIEALGTVFPIIFLIVAVLMSLTTITRKVEEERGLIGTYKALGFTNGEIRRKYVVFALTASFIGGIIGDIFGFVILPKIIFAIFSEMYCLPEFMLKFDLIYGIGGIILFTFSIGLATMYACSNELKRSPAVLMRPKAPKAGSRVILEHIPFIWNNMSFLNKVTARNLFRYKKRLMMTILGIMGCTALLVCGFAIKDSVTALLPMQYEWIYSYDYQAVSTDEDNSSMVSLLDGDDRVDSFINIRMETAKLRNSKGKEDSLQIMAMPRGTDYEGYLYLEDVDGKEKELPKSGIVLTENSSRVLGLKVGDKVSLQNIDLKEGQVEVVAIVKNYLGNKVYMSESAYEEVFGKLKCNSVLVNFKDSFTDHQGFASELEEVDGVMSSLAIETFKAEFTQSFTLVNMAVYIIISLAAGLAVVVLFTLSTTNISERERELATIKVLGFYDGEVHSYVNKETFILTMFGILLGLPFGYYLGVLMMDALVMPAVHFTIVLEPISYVYSVGMAMLFALVVNVFTNKILNKINPVEALKSVE